MRYIIDTSIFNGVKILDTSIYDEEYYGTLLHRYELMDRLKNPKTRVLATKELSLVIFKNHWVVYLMFIWVHGGVDVYLWKYFFIENLMGINCDYFNLTFIGVYIYIVDTMVDFPLSYRLKTTLFVNFILKLVLFIEIIISL